MAQNSETTRANWTGPIYRKGFIDLCPQEMSSSSSEDDDINLEAKREAKRLLRNRLITLYLKGPYTKQGAIGTIDGTLIHTCIPIEEQVPYRGRGKGECYKNIMAICDFDMIFRYIVVGWEGTTHDSRVLTETIRNPSHNFPMPPDDKYYLVDVAYSYTKGFMTPYRQVRYWMSPYSFYTRKNIVIACIALHNFLRHISIDDELFSQYEDEELIVENDNANHQLPNTNNSSGTSNAIFMQWFRDHIPEKLLEASL
ncbi:hypothetical protein Ddye_028919 [Dipteronia dyeriana]|uniref:DDE Tnp4 domain-containing protein n=1 Tax=Dipteronia dyeriana TaxID=168575 RepID=A0AAD9WL07_9ROSI|nr:hypothetical protein Ddye_028919 [Dipteronia dyeriana]